MKCQQCGKPIRRGEVPTLTIRSEQIGNPRSDGARTKTERLWICPACADSRRSTATYMMLIPIAIVLGAAIIMMLVKFVR